MQDKELYEKLLGLTAAEWRGWTNQEPETSQPNLAGLSPVIFRRDLLFRCPVVCAGSWLGRPGRLLFRQTSSTELFFPFDYAY
jgi:hypothetical protein